jgi:preprotein translocase subunit SecG
MIKIIIGLAILAALVIGVVLVYRNNKANILAAADKAAADATAAQGAINSAVDKAKAVADAIKK